MARTKASDMRSTTLGVVDRLRAEAAHLRECAAVHVSTHPDTARVVADTAAHIDLTADALDHLVGTSLELPTPRRAEPGGIGDHTFEDHTYASTAGWLAMFAVKGVEHHRPDEALAEKLSLACEGDRSLIEETVARIESLTDVDPATRRRAIGVVERAARM